MLLILFVLAVIGGFAVSFQRWEGQPPTIRFDREFKSLGRKPPLSLQIEDAGNGLSQHFGFTEAERPVGFLG